ncbi:hypothetical protein PTSG_08873 [Salpingoeca rosetta]|uniref:Peptidase C-terminal archaeal/bacterial domain-containing protein n=1 Tax=Salpingoeca rosetta (strain ATCC 50818 / BSB-021) TaxID=946362 RepID=F2UKY4_SALR5|nr:uncharacterized protein PTSG_08873 [Salpingoeca rosetta]EGD77783.1 hypothetical protein PTSG_08873 [Salpingoeca rosetta]|eukprot:XP_004990259.1 hypothetical protein PTSG_08873 [Salpingoeca rosetta]
MAHNSSNWIRSSPGPAALALVVAVLLVNTLPLLAAPRPNPSKQTTAPPARLVNLPSPPTPRLTPQTLENLGDGPTQLQAAGVDQDQQQQQQEPQHKPQRRRRASSDTGKALDEAGSTPATAASVNLVNSHAFAATGVISSPTDVDWWRVQVTDTNGAISASVKRAPVNADGKVVDTTSGVQPTFHLNLFNSDGGLVPAANDLFSKDPAVLLRRNLQPGTYFLSVSIPDELPVLPAAFATLGRYALEGSYPSQAPPSGYDTALVCSDDQFEENDESDNAYVLSEEQTSFDAVVCESDFDWYRVYVCAGGQVAIDVLFDHETGDLDAYLYDSEGNNVVAATSATDNEYLTHTDTVGGGWYWLVVYGYYTDTTAPYHVDIAVTCSGCPDDQYEENDFYEDAYWFSAGVTHFDAYTCPEDFDWFRFFVCEGAEKVTATVTFDQDVVDLTARMYNAAGNSVAFSNSTTDNEVLVDEDVTDPGYYYLDIWGYWVTSTGPYSVDIQVEGCSECEDDEYETEDNSPYVLPSATSGFNFDAVMCDTDPFGEDWYRVTFPCFGNTTITLTDDDASDLDFDVYDTSGNLIGGSYSGGNVDTFSFYVNSTGMGWLLVYPYTVAAGGAPYHVDIHAECFTTEEPTTSMCTNDNFEPNNDYSNAYVLDASEFNFNAVLCSDEEDWYRVRVCAYGDLDITLTFDHESADIDVALYDADGYYVAQGNSTTDNEFISYTDVAGGGLYYLYVYGYNNSPQGTPYGVSIDMACPECEDDQFEDNDTPQTATPLSTLPASLDAHACPQDEDFFAVEVCSGGTLDVTVLFSHAVGDVDLRLYDANLTEVASSTSTSDNEAVSHTNTLATPAVFYIHVYGYSGASAPYHLDVAVDCEGCADDQYEDNDSYTSATVLSVDDTEIDAYACPQDEDWYRVPVCAGGHVVVSVLFDHDNGDIDASLFDADGYLVALGNSTTDNEVLVHTSAATQDGLYYLYVGGYSGDSGSYHISINVTCHACDNDEFEPNNNGDSATVLTASQTQFSAVICPNDEDVYRFPVCANGNVSVSVFFSNDEGNLDAYLYDASGSLVSSGVSTTDNEVLAHSAGGVGGLYYLRVVGVGGASAPYQVLIEVQCPPCHDDQFEDNNDPESATELAPFVDSISASICPEDEDYYAIPVCGLGTITVNLAFEHDVGDIELHLFDSSGTLVASSTSSTDHETVQHTDTTGSASMYMVRVYGYQGASAPYAMFFDVVCPPCEPDSFESNDVPDSATVLSTQHTSFDASICYGDDDWYRVPVCAGGRIAIAIEFEHAGGDLDMALFNSAGKLIGKATSVTDNEVVVYTDNSAADSLYLLRVYGFNGATNQYKVHINITCTPLPFPPYTCPENDEHEPNNVRQTEATRVSTPGTFTGVLCNGENDWFTFHVCKRGVIRAHLSVDPDTANKVNLSIHKRRGKRKIREKLRGGQVEAEIEAQAGRAGYYYVLVDSVKRTASQVYRLTIEIDGCDE